MPGRSSAFNLAPIFVMAVLLVGFILPPTQQTFLNPLERLLPLIELGVLGRCRGEVGVGDGVRRFLRRFG